MANLFRHTEIAERFGIPKPTTANWSKEAKAGLNTWRAKLYIELEKLRARELAEIAKEK